MQAERNQLFTAHTVKEAAVLVGIVLYEGAWQILLTKRAETLRQHTGQIAFAGGRKDTQDDSLTATALREADEETAIPIPHGRLLRRYPSMTRLPATVLRLFRQFAPSPSTQKPIPTK